MLDNYRRVPRCFFIAFDFPADVSSGGIQGNQTGIGFLIKIQNNTITIDNGRDSLAPAEAGMQTAEVPLPQQFASQVVGIGAK